MKTNYLFPIHDLRLQNMNNVNSKSNLPLLIIGAVLLAAIVGGWWFYSNSKTPPVKTVTNSANTNVLTNSRQRKGIRLCKMFITMRRRARSLRICSARRLRL
jgi:hypothetical protein